MTTPDYRALCAELVELSALVDSISQLTERLQKLNELADRARALLAEPEGTDGEVPRIGHILRLAEIIREVDGKHDKGAAALAEAILSHPGIRSAGLTAALAEPEAEGPTDEELLASVRHFYGDQTAADMGAEDDLRTARAALARWGRPAAPPVPGAGHTYFEFVISDGYDCTQAGGIAPTYAQALSEGQHYLAQYQQDGPHELELRRVEVLNPDALPLPAPEGGESQP